MNCKTCEFWKEQVCLKADNLSHMEDLSCLLKVVILELRFIRDSLSENELLDGDEWKD